MKKLSFLAFFMAGVLAVHAQLPVTGRITDQNNNPVPNASVKEKGSKNGVSADEQGNFRIM